MSGEAHDRIPSERLPGDVNAFSSSLEAGRLVRCGRTCSPEIGGTGGAGLSMAKRQLGSRRIGVAGERVDDLSDGQR